MKIRTLGMLRSRFEAIPRAFGKKLVPNHGSHLKQDEVWLWLCYFFLYPSFYAIVLMDLIVDLMNFFHQEDKNPPFDKFADIWNAFINSLREEDLLSNRFPLLLNFLDFLY